VKRVTSYCRPPTVTRQVPGGVPEAQAACAELELRLRAPSATAAPRASFGNGAKKAGKLLTEKRSAQSPASLPKQAASPVSISARKAQLGFFWGVGLLASSWAAADSVAQITFWPQAGLEGVGTADTIRSVSVTGHRAGPQPGIGPGGSYRQAIRNCFAATRPSDKEPARLARCAPAGVGD